MDFKIIIVLGLFFQIAEIYCKDHSDVPGYRIYDIFIKTEEEVNILQEMINNKIITVINKKDPFKWKVLVRANNELFMQRKLIENRMAYIIVKSSLTASPDELGIGQRSFPQEDEAESADDHHQHTTGQHPQADTSQNQQTYMPPQQNYPAYQPPTYYYPYYDPNMHLYNGYYQSY